MESTDKIRVVIAQRYRLFREGLQLMLDDEDSIEIVGKASSPIQAINFITDLKPDVILLDLTFAKVEVNDSQPFVAIKQQSPKTKVLLLYAKKDDSLLFSCIEEGAKGYLSQNIAPCNLLKAIHTVHRGELWVERKSVAKYFDQKYSTVKRGKNRHKTKKNLTPREEEILRLLTKGLTNKEIANDLFISDKTVKAHLNSIFRKLNVTRRLQAILYAISRGMS